MGRLGEGVLVGPLSYAVGLDLDLVVVLGMAEGTLPAAVHDDSLLPDGERPGRATSCRCAASGWGATTAGLAALAAADRHLLCLPRSDLRASSERVPRGGWPTWPRRWRGGRSRPPSWWPARHRGWRRCRRSPTP